MGVPAALVAGVQRGGRDITRLTAAMGEAVELDWLALLGERAAIVGLGRRGDVSCGGAARMLRVSDGWLALSLARADDVAAVPAWLEVDGLPEAAGNAAVGEH
ncbi:MAG TPA: hypothetical protein PLV68_09855, partial [Ilumatobacteraceae bacterium]|nr:hypothetical protein [Ilumatobacteraceae bacterium]